MLMLTPKPLQHPLREHWMETFADVAEVAAFAAQPAEEIFWGGGGRSFPPVTDASTAKLPQFTPSAGKFAVVGPQVQRHLLQNIIELQPRHIVCMHYWSFRLAGSLGTCTVCTRPKP